MVSSKKGGRQRSQNAASSKKTSSRRSGSTSTRKTRPSGSMATKKSKKNKLPAIPVWKHEPQIKYRLSDERFKALGWTSLPVVTQPETTIKKKIITYRTVPSKPNVFKSHALHVNKYYSDGSPLAVFKKNGMGSIYYPDGHVAVTRQKGRHCTRYTVLSPGGRDPNTNLKRYPAICGLFDSFGNGVIYDVDGDVLLKYNQKRGMLAKNSHGVPIKWTWPGAFTEEKHLAELERGEWIRLEDGGLKHVVKKVIDKGRKVCSGSSRNEYQVKTLFQKRAKRLSKEVPVEAGQEGSAMWNRHSISSTGQRPTLLGKDVNNEIGEYKSGRQRGVSNVQCNEGLDTVEVGKKSSIKEQEVKDEAKGTVPLRLRRLSQDPKIELKSSLILNKTFIKKDGKFGKKVIECLERISEEKEFQPLAEDSSDIPVIGNDSLVKQEGTDSKESVGDDLVASNVLPKNHGPVSGPPRAPIEPIIMRLNEFLTLRVADQENVALVFCAQKHTLRIELGVRVDVSLPVRVDKYTCHVTDHHVTDKSLNFFELVPTKSLVQVTENLAKRRAHAERKKIAPARGKFQ